MTDQTQRTVWALQQFQSFVDRWTAPAMQEFLQDDILHVKDCIRLIAPPYENPVVGYAVFGQRPDHERESGFEHVAISAVADTLGQVQNAYDYAVSKGDAKGCDHFVICAVQQIP